MQYRVLNALLGYIIKESVGPFDIFFIDDKLKFGVSFFRVKIHFMVKNKNKDKVGYFFKRNNVVNVKVKDFLQELKILLFEASVIRETIHCLQRRQLFMLDSAVGDWKCQTRASMILDVIHDDIFLTQDLYLELSSVNSLIVKIKNYCGEVELYDATQQQKLTKELQKYSLYECLSQYELNFDFSEKLLLLSLCFVNCEQNYNAPIFMNHQISMNKMYKLLKASKKNLCELSVDHEQSLAKVHGSHEEQKLLTQVESKSICSMTSSFAGSRVILKKMKNKQQFFVANNITFCRCGGIQDVEVKFFTLSNNEFISTQKVLGQDQFVMVINSYQFPGSLMQLQGILGIPLEEPFIPKKYYQKCKCAYPTLPNNLIVIEKAILAFFAQHPQFTNNAKMDFEGLALSDSKVKKEYDHLLTLPGFNRQDMGVFHIDHIYASTIEQVLKEQQEVQESLELCSNK